MTRRTTGKRSESGAVAILVVLLVTAIFGMMAIAMDLSRLRVARAAAQGVADNAALAAAWSSCKGNSAAQAGADGVDVATANGYTATVAPTAEEGVWRAIVDVTVDATFAQLIGSGPTLENKLGAAAREDCPPSTSSPYAVIATATTCGESTLEFDVADSAVSGYVRSNGDMTLRGTDVAFDGRGSYAGELRKGSGVTWSPTPLKEASPPRRAPAYMIETYQAVADVDTTETITLGWLKDNGYYDSSTNVIESGVYYSTAGIDLDLDDDVTGQVTFVTTGQIQVTGDGSTFTPQLDGLLFLSARLGDCTDPSIQIDVADAHWEGAIAAPQSRIDISANGLELYGAIFARTIAITGTALDLNPSTGEDDPPTVLLHR